MYFLNSLERMEDGLFRVISSQIRHNDFPARNTAPAPTGIDCRINIISRLYSIAMNPLESYRFETLLLTGPPIQAYIAHGTLKRTLIFVNIYLLYKTNIFF